MSWIIGIVAKKGETPKAPEYSKSLKPSYEHGNDNVFICAGGSKLAFAHGVLADGRSYFVLGYPLVLKGDSYSRPAELELSVLMATEAGIRTLQGRFLLVITDWHTLWAYNDATGMRSAYVHENASDIVLCSSLKHFKAIRKPEIDFALLGIRWHTMLPFETQKYAPTLQSYYQNTFVMGSAASLKIDDKISLKNRLFGPDPASGDIYKMLQSATLQPLKSGFKMALSLSAGLDIRTLLAICQKSGMEFSAFHYGDAEAPDFYIAAQIAKDCGFRLQRISHEDSLWSDTWEQSVDYMGASPITANPLRAPFREYCRMVAGEADFMLSGYFGELFRLRFYAAHIRSAFRVHKPDRNYIQSYLYSSPPRIFLPEYALTLHNGFKQGLNLALDAMPDANGMSFPKWLNLFFCRYTFHSKSMDFLSDLDAELIDHMPWLISGVLSQHWQLPTVFQSAEQVHRKLIRKHYPMLEDYPLVIGDTIAPYSWPHQMIKAKAMIQKRHSKPQVNPIDIFLAKHRQQICDLFASQRVQRYFAYDIPHLQKCIKGYYAGEHELRSTLITWLAFELGK